MTAVPKPATETPRENVERFLNEVRKGMIVPRADYVTTIVSKTSAQA